jgi:hypothetical protein
LAALHNVRARRDRTGYGGAMASKSTKEAPTACPEFAVRRETISAYFHPPHPSSTFHDFVNKGKIIPMKGIRGFYLLNASLRRLGLREVPGLPKDPTERSMEDIIRLAFSLIDPLAFPPPSWLLAVETIDMKDADHARRIADQHREAVDALDNVHLKIAYQGGVLDAQFMAEGEQTWVD